MKDLSRRGQNELKFKKTHILKNQPPSYHSFHCQMARMPVFYPENWGGNKVLHFLPSFSNFQEVL